MGRKQPFLMFKLEKMVWGVGPNPPWASQVALLVKNLPANAGYARDVGSVPGSRRSPGGGHGYPLQYPCLENSMDRGAWQAAVHGVTHTHTHTTLLKAGHILLHWHRLQRKTKTIGIY